MMIIARSSSSILMRNFRMQFSEMMVAAPSMSGQLVSSRHAHHKKWKRSSNKSSKNQNFTPKKLKESDESVTWHGLQTDVEYLETDLIPKENMLDKIVDDLKKNGTTFIIPGKESLARLQLINCFEKLIGYGVKPEFILDANIKNAQLFRCFATHPELSIKIIETLVNFGYVTFEDAIRLLAIFPDDLINYGAENLAKNIESLSNCGISTARSIRAVVRKCPPVLFARDPNEMSKLAHEIGAFFSRRQASQLIERCPQILLKSVEEIEEKYEYVFYQMGVEAEELSECSNWIEELTVEDMAIRHQFLQLCGKYTMPDPKRPQIRKENPKLIRILDTDDMDFATNVAKVSLEEWNVFRSLKIKEQENENKDRKFERVKPSKRKAYERRHKSRQYVGEHVFDVSAISTTV